MKRSMKILLAILIIAIIMLIIFIVIKNASKEEVVEGKDYSHLDIKDDELENNNKYIKLEDLEIDYNLSKMIEDECYILLNSNIVYNIEELDDFMDNVENNISDEIRIVQYTIEGQPILTNLEYKDNKFIVKIDNRRDGYAAKDEKKIITKEYDGAKYKLLKGNTPNSETNFIVYYPLELKDLETNTTVNICNYAKRKKTTDSRFKIEFNDEQTNKEIVDVLKKGENNKYNYNIYSYKGTVDIEINDKKMSLRDALINNEISVEEILEKAQKDAFEDKIIFGDHFLDGGSTIYIYDDYAIIKLNTLDGNNDLYIGVPSMNINDLD